jgi:hypothetical protein
MTLQNGLIHQDQAYLWCDEAFFLATGQLSHLQSKAMKSLTWPYAISAASNGGNPHDIFHAVASTKPTDLVSLLSAVSDALRAYASAGNIASTLIAAWEGEARLFFAATIPMQGEAAFEPFEILHHVCSGNELPAYQEAVASGLTPDSMANVIAAQIETPYALEGPMGASGKHIWFGGGIVEIEVSRTGVSERVIRMVDGSDVK